MNDIDFLTKLASSRLHGLKEKTAEIRTVPQFYDFARRHPEVSSSTFEGAKRFGLDLENATPGEAMESAIKAGHGMGPTYVQDQAGRKKGKTKKAGVKDHIQSVVDLAKLVVKNNKPEIAGAIIGGAAMGLMQYKASKKNLETGTSPEQDAGQKAVDYSDKQRAETLASGKQPGMVSDVAHGGAQFYKTVADSFSNHPGKAALMSVPAGATAGMAAAKKLFK